MSLGNGSTHAGRQVVLVTGCSTGVGAATAVLAAERGHQVVATARAPEKLAALPEGVLKLRLDVGDPESIARALTVSEEAFGPVTALVNNAAYGEPGPLEYLGDERVRQQFDTNVFGPLRLIRAVLPGMRRAGGGTIVNLSTAAARMGLPSLGLYLASKLALEGLSDSLRNEVSAFGIRVVVVAPGPIRSAFATNAYRRVDPEWVLGENPYWSVVQRVARMTRDVERKHGQDPAAAATVIVDSIESTTPRPFYSVTSAGRVATWVMSNAPDRMARRVRRRLAHTDGRK